MYICKSAVSLAGLERHLFYLRCTWTSMVLCLPPGEEQLQPQLGTASAPASFPQGCQLLLQQLNTAPERFPHQAKTVALPQDGISPAVAEARLPASSASCDSTYTPLVSPQHGFMPLSTRKHSDHSQGVNRSKDSPELQEHKHLAGLVSTTEQQSPRVVQSSQSESITGAKLTTPVQANTVAASEAQVTLCMDAEIEIYRCAPQHPPKPCVLRRDCTTLVPETHSRMQRSQACPTLAHFEQQHPDTQAPVQLDMRTQALMRFARRMLSKGRAAEVLAQPKGRAGAVWPHGKGWAGSVLSNVITTVANQSQSRPVLQASMANKRQFQLEAASCQAQRVPRTATGKGQAQLAKGSQPKQSSGLVQASGASVSNGSARAWSPAGGCPQFEVCAAILRRQDSSNSMQSKHSSAGSARWDHQDSKLKGIEPPGCWKLATNHSLERHKPSSACAAGSCRHVTACRAGGLQNGPAACRLHHPALSAGSLKSGTACKAGSVKLPGTVLLSTATQRPGHSLSTATRSAARSCQKGSGRPAKRFVTFADICDQNRHDKRSAVTATSRHAVTGPSVCHKRHSVAGEVQSHRCSPARQAAPARSDLAELGAEWYQVAQDFEQLLASATAIGIKDCRYLTAVKPQAQAVSLPHKPTAQQSRLTLSAQQQVPQQAPQLQSHGGESLVQWWQNPLSQMSTSLAAGQDRDDGDPESEVVFDQSEHQHQQAVQADHQENQQQLLGNSKHMSGVAAAQDQHWLLGRKARSLGGVQSLLQLAEEAAHECQGQSYQRERQGFQLEGQSCDLEGQTRQLEGQRYKLESQSCQDSLAASFPVLALDLADCTSPAEDSKDRGSCMRRYLLRISTISMALEWHSPAEDSKHRRHLPLLLPKNSVPRSFRCSFL